MRLLEHLMLHKFLGKHYDAFNLPSMPTSVGKIICRPWRLSQAMQR